MRHLTFKLLGFTIIGLLALPCHATPLPEGWQPLPLPTLSGSFLEHGQRGTAMLVQNPQQHTYGVAVAAEPASGATARIVKTFRAIAPNPPQLSLIKPGNYQPACHNGGDCALRHIDSEAISVCFGEASCGIIYADGSAFREIAVTD